MKLTTLSRERETQTPPLRWHCSVAGLRKRYGNVEAVRGVDLAVQPGEFGAKRMARAGCRTAGKS